MNLTDKCKIDFERWLKDNYHEYDFYNTMEWWEHIFSMQYGVYVDFFDSVGIWINIDSDMTDTASEIYDIFHYEINGVGIWESSRSEELLFETRYEARKKVLEKANEIYNKTK